MINQYYVQVPLLIFFMELFLPFKPQCQAYNPFRALISLLTPLALKEIFLFLLQLPFILVLSLPISGKILRFHFEMWIGLGVVEEGVGEVEVALIDFTQSWKEWDFEEKVVEEVSQHFH